jgi:hypothetical protein
MGQGTMVKILSAPLALVLGQVPGDGSFFDTIRRDVQARRKGQLQLLPHWRATSIRRQDRPSILSLGSSPTT